MLECTAVLLGIVAVCMIFVHSLTVNLALGATAEYTGLQATFGYTAKGTLVDVVHFSFSFMNLLSYLLVLAAVVLVVLRLANVVKAKAVDWIAVILFVVAGVLFFLMPQLAVSELYNGVTKTLAVGAILSAVFSLVAGALVCVKAVLKK
ncbi:MAG: hypothetical protein IJ538_03565 [Clostridia bacterium]|nr:hypothetical protein [Clostridia bacterium]